MNTIDRRQYFQQFLVLFTGTSASQIFNFLSYPLLSRVYLPADFGYFGIFIAVSAIPGAIACGRFELAIVTAPHSGRRALLWLCWSLALIVSLFATMMVSLYWWRINMPDLGLLAPLLFTAILLTGVTNATTVYLIRHDAFRVASTSVVVRTATTVISQVSIALTWHSPIGLIIGFCLGLLVQALLVVLSARKYCIGKHHIGQMRAMFRRYLFQVSVDIPGSVLAALTVNLIPFFLQFLYGADANGFYLLGQRIAALPLQLFNDSISQVYFQRAARAKDERGEFWREFRFTLLCSGLLSLGILAGLELLAKPVIVLFLGAKWEMAGTILVILAPMLAIRSVTMSLATTVFLLHRPAWLLYHNIASVIAISIALGIAWASGGGDLLSFLGLLALFQGVGYAGFLLILGFAARKEILLSKVPVL